MLELIVGIVIAAIVLSILFAWRNARDKKRQAAEDTRRARESQARAMADTFRRRPEDVFMSIPSRPSLNTHLGAAHGVSARNSAAQGHTPQPDPMEGFMIGYMTGVVYNPGSAVGSMLHNSGSSDHSSPSPSSSSSCDSGSSSSYSSGSSDSGGGSCGGGGVD